MTSVTVTAIGAAGQSTDAGVNTGGLGASVFSTVGVFPGEVLYVEVGGVGASPTGGFNGGGDGAATAGGGGGAFDVRTIARANAGTTLPSRLVVAAGGGGAGSDGTCLTAGSGGNGGNQATAGDNGSVRTTGGGGGGGSSGTFWQCTKHKHTSFCSRSAKIGAHGTTTITVKVKITAGKGTLVKSKATVSPSDSSPADNTSVDFAIVHKK